MTLNPAIYHKNLWGFILFYFILSYLPRMGKENPAVHSEAMNPTQDTSKVDQLKQSFKKSIQNQVQKKGHFIYFFNGWWVGNGQD